MPSTAAWDDAYANSAHIPGSEALPARWAAEAARYRADGRAITLDLPYGPGARQRLDLIHPEGTARGLVVFVHGGYWLAFDKSGWSHFAEGARAAGWAVALPSYTLAPAARISTMTGEIAAAITTAAERIAGPIHLAGHSAGGHLVTRMICDDSPLDPAIHRRIGRVVAISGLHDLRPLLNTTMNQTLGLDGAEASAESPALHRPHPLSGATLTAWVGGGERPEFIRQSQLITTIWAGLQDQPGTDRPRLVIDPGHHHFSVIDGLTERDAPLTRHLIGLDQPAA